MEQKVEKVLVEAATKYLAMGFSVIPVGRDKKPVGSWKEFQSKPMRASEVEAIFGQKDVGGVGIVTGRISGIVVLDVEAGETTEDLLLPKTVIALSGGGGVHYYFKLPGETDVRNSTRIMDRRMDVRGEGGYIVAPPSQHPSGNCYSWKEGYAPGEMPLADLPDWLVSPVVKVSPDGKKSRSAIGVSEGERNDAASRIAGKLLSHIPEADWDEFAWPLFAGWNKLNNPPLEERELRSVFDSIGKREHEKLAPAKRERRPWSLGDIMGFAFEEIPWVIQHLMPANGLVALSGHPSSFKTWIALEIAKSVSAGIPFLGRFRTDQGNVLVIDEEDTLQNLKSRSSFLGIPHDAPIFFFSREGFRLDDPRDADYLATLVKEKNIKLVVVDSLIRVHSQEENDASGMAAVFRSFHKLTKAGACVLFIHHHRKADGDPRQSLRGSSDILAAADSHIAIERKDNTITLRQPKLRQAESFEPFALEIKSEPGRISFVVGGEVDEEGEQDADEAAGEAIIALVSGEPRPWGRREIEERLKAKFGRNAVNRAIPILVEDGRLKRTPDPQNPQRQWYSLPNTVPPL